MHTLARSLITDASETLKTSVKNNACIKSPQSRCCMFEAFSYISIHSPGHVYRVAARVVSRAMLCNFRCQLAPQAVPRWNYKMLIVLVFFMFPFPLCFYFFSLLLRHIHQPVSGLGLVFCSSVQYIYSTLAFFVR